MLIIAVIILSLPNLIFSALFDLRLRKQDTRVLAYHWVTENIPSGRPIRNLGISGEIPFVENKAVIALIKEHTPGLYSSKRKYLDSLADDTYPKPNYFIINYPGLVADYYSFTYLIFSDFDKNALSATAAKFARPK